MKNKITIGLFLLINSIAATAMQSEQAVQSHIKSTQAKLEFNDKEKGLVQQSTKMALESFNNGKLAAFDPLVGEWQCHLRAFIVIKLFKLNQASKALTKEDEEFLGLSRLLTQGKKVKDVASLYHTQTETTDHSRCFDGGATKGKLFIHKCQSLLAHYTLTAMQTQAKELNDQALIDSMKIAREDHYKRIHCAFFYGMKTFLAGILKYKVPLLIKTNKYEGDEVVKYDFLYTVGHDNRYSRESKPQCKNEPVIVIEGVSGGSQSSSLDFDFQNLDIPQLLLVSAAHHQQFAGTAHDTSPFQSQEMEQVKTFLADKFLRNEKGGPYIFVIDHIYPSTIQEESDLKSKFETIQKLFDNKTQLSDLIMMYTRE